MLQQVAVGKKFASSGAGVRCWRRSACVSCRAGPDPERPPPPPPEAPPLREDVPPPPPLSEATAAPEPRPNRRDIGLLIGTGSLLWWWRLRELDPPVRFHSGEDGWMLMDSPAGQFGVATVQQPDGRDHFLMVDKQGRLFYDPDDRALGIYIVDTDMTVYNANPSVSVRGSMDLDRVGNLRDIKAFNVGGIAGVELQDDGELLWAFDETDKQLKINPLAFMDRDDKGEVAGMSYPGIVDEGRLTLEEKNQGLLGMFAKKEGPYGGPLKREMD